MKQPKFIFLLISICYFNINCLAESSISKSEQLYAFSILYGHIKYFSVNKTLNDQDMDDLLLRGIRSCTESKEKNIFIDDMKNLFSPYASIDLNDVNAAQKYQDNCSDLYSVYYKFIGPKIKKRFKKQKLSNDNQIVTIPIFENLFFHFRRIDCISSLDGNKNNLLSSDANEEEKKMATLISHWNLIQHFYPYLKSRKLDWKKLLSESIKALLATDDLGEKQIILNELFANLKDSHFGFYYTEFSQKNSEYAILPFSVKQFQGKYVVSDPNSEFLGQSIDSICNYKCEDYNSLNAYFNNTSGGTVHFDTYLKEHLSTSFALPYTIYFNNGKVLKVSEDKSTEKEIYKVNDSIVYINIPNVSPTKLSNVIKENSKKYFIFDYRARNNFKFNTSPEKLLSYLTDTKITRIPPKLTEYNYPNQEGIINENDESNFYDIKPKSPLLQKKQFVVLVNSQVISYLESCVETIKNYELGTIIGEKTGGIMGAAYWYHSFDHNLRITIEYVSDRDGIEPFREVLPDVIYEQSYEDLFKGQNIIDFAVEYLSQQ